MKKIFILGGGITGRLAKKMLPDSVCIESKGPEDLFTAEVGVHISIVPIPELNYTAYVRYIQIDGKSPTLESIGLYRKKISREGAMTYGDYRQFEPKQDVFKHEFPRDIDISFGKKVEKIDLVSKKIVVSGEIFDYDYIISTIPLMNLVKITNLFEFFKDSTESFFMHRPIYVLREFHPTDPNTICENYITDPDVPIYRENFIDGWHNRESLYKIEGSVKIYPGKIYPTAQAEKILEDLMSYGIFCAGRYAQWDNTIHLWNTYRQLKFIKEMVK